MTATLSPQQTTTAASLWLDTESHQAAELVLNHVDDPQRYPRDLTLTATLNFHIQIKRMAGLSLASANNWFLARGSARAFEGDNRLLHGCCFSSKGHGTIFIDSTDDANEQRFTLAHELSHYLLDHLLPRQAAIQWLGNDILPVLNGDRPPTMVERFRSWHKQLPIGSTYNLMERSRDPHAAYEISGVEARADRLALALLAPVEQVLANLPNDSFQSQLELLSQRLHAEFGLPAQVSVLYADALLLTLGRAPTRFARRPQS